MNSHPPSETSITNDIPEPRADTGARLKFETPVFRRGLIVRAVRNRDGERVPVRRNAAEALQLGQLIADSLDSYLKVIPEAFNSVARRRSLTLKPPAELPNQTTRARYAPGLIIDFPAHEATIGDFTIRERTCITVCQEEDASKIWTRLLLFDGDGRPVDEEQANSFFKLSDALSQAILRRVRALYRTAFLAQQEETNRNSLDFEDVGRLDFYGTDIPDLGLTAEEAELSRYGAGRLEDAILLRRQFRPLMSSITGRKATLAELDNLAVKDLMYCAEGITPVLYTILFEPKRAIFLVLSEPGDSSAVPAPKRAGIRRPSGALWAMRTLATEVGREF
jgi:hypothetical protein